uniref:Uncharacterized protein n=1 Tax=Panagrolaimus sp. PS1159 TaxID=55785 RepID=A0AC35FKE5_9BILA
MADPRKNILFVLVFLVLLSLSLQKEEECYKASALHFKDDHCSMSPSSYDQLKTASKLCANIVYLGYHEKSEKYMFLTNELSLIGFEDESNVWTKVIVHEDIEKYNFTIIKSQLLENHLNLLALHNDLYYILTVDISKGNKEIDASIVKLGNIELIFANFECDNMFFIKADDDKVFLYEKDGSTFHDEMLNLYNQKIKSIKQLKPSKFEVLLNNNITEPLLCEQCILNKKTSGEKFNESKTNQIKPAVIQIISENVGIVIVLSIFCATLLIFILIAGIIYYRRCQKKKAKRKVIKLAEDDKLLENKEDGIILTSNISSAPQNDNPDIDVETLGDSHL